MLDLDEPLADVALPWARGGHHYRSLLVIARLGGDPLGAVAMPVQPDGRVSRDRLAFELRRQLELPTSIPAEGIAGLRACAGPRRAELRSVSVVVTTCRDPVALERSVGSILASDYGAVEVIVVENRPDGSDTGHTLGELFGDDPRVQYVEEPSPGLARARNAGLAAAKGDVVAFTDDDVMVDPGWVRRSAAAFDRADDVACVTGLILPLELETDTQLHLEQFGGFGKGFRRRMWRLEEARSSDPLMPYTPGAIGSGANTVLRADIANELGGFDPTLGAGSPAAGGEDLDLYIRVLREGHAVAYEPSAIVWHAHRDGQARLRHQVYGYGVGLGATLAKQLVAGPERRELLRAVPAGIRYARDPASRKNAGKTTGYPHRLDWLERLGMVTGPAAYLASAFEACLAREAPVTGGRAVNGRVHHVDSLRLADGDAVDVVEVGRPGIGLRRERARPLATGTEWALTATAVAACVAAPLLVALQLPAPLRFAATLAFLCLVPGTALIAIMRGRAEIGLALGVSLGTSTVLAQSMLWLDAWHPKAYLYGLAAVCFPPLAGRLHLSRRLGHARFLQRARSAMARVPPYAAAHGALLSAALLLWGVSLHGADLSRIAGLGLLNALPPTYFLAFALLLGGFALAVTRDQLEPRLLALYVLALVLVLHGTTPLLYDEPRYPWVYKHIAVINLIAQGGGVDRHIDIYNNWPGFFALNAWLSTLGGVAPIRYAEWAQVFFNLANVAALRFALRGVTRDERLLWTATWLFLLANWIGQDYLAPQAFGFFLALVVLGLCLRCGPSRRAPSLRLGRWWAARLESLSRVLTRGVSAREVVPPAPLSTRAAVVAGGLCYLAVVISHQLTPVMLLTGVTALALLDRRVPLWIPAAMAVVEAWWLTLGWNYLTAHYSLFDPNPTASGLPSGYEVGRGLAGLSVVIYAGRVEVALAAAIAALGLIRRLRAGRWDLAAAILLVTPVPVIGLQSYSGEGRYRFYMFALPWLCFFAAAACASMSGARHRRSLRLWSLALVSGALGACFLLANYGLELSNRVTRDDVAAAVWFDQHAPRNSLLVEVTSNSISRVTGRYARVFNPRFPGSPTLTGTPGFRRRRLGPRDLHRIEGTLRGYDVPHTYLVLSRSQEDFARLYGILPAGWRQSLERALRSSHQFDAVYRRGTSSIFEYKPPPKGGSSP